MDQNESRRMLDKVVAQELRILHDNERGKACMQFLADMIAEYVPFVPEPGLPCTISIGGDRYAHVVLAVHPKGNICWIGSVGETARPDRSNLTDRNEWRKGRDGAWRPKGGGKRSGYHITFGHAEDYRDPSS